MSIRILGIDPGFANIGIFGMTLGLGMSAEFSQLILTAKDHGVPTYQDEMRRLDEIERSFESVLESFQPHLVASERTASLRNAMATRQLAFAFGAMHSRARKRGIPVLIFDPEGIKEELTGDRHADKNKMAKALIGLFPAFKGWPALGSQKAKQGRRAKVKKHDAIAHVVDAAGACVCARRSPVVDELLSATANA